MSIPINSKKSALPQNPETDLFPCFAILQPAAEAITAAAVLILNDLKVSPPVPHVSTNPFLTIGVIWMAEPFTALTMELISSDVSPFIARATKNDAIAASVAFPPRIRLIEILISCSDKLFLETNFLITGRRSLDVSLCTHFFTIEMKLRR